MIYVIHHERILARIRQLADRLNLALENVSTEAPVPTSNQDEKSND